MKNDARKRICLTVLVLLTALCSVFLVFPARVYASENVSGKQAPDFIEGKPEYSVRSQRLLRDFAENSFSLYELNPTGYAIYTGSDVLWKVLTKRTLRTSVPNRKICIISGSATISVTKTR